MVWAYNDTTGNYDLKRVKQLFSYIRDTIYAVSIGGEIINSTSDHPFFVFGKRVRVHDLKVGDSLQTYAGQKLAVNSITIIPGQRTVYNFEVEDYHTYYVSDKKVLVHNAGPCKTKLPDKTIAQQDGVTIEHYYKSGDHAPAHAHVKG
ncbi:polymorphic toxin-type HINT domain-containing protein [Longitalea arenae]|uniref:polymorphic toxin-type HINT domain-containing protein n=1 Tax=Longitalea arenae TaxID=2812558 RepID=UPI0019685A6F